MTIEVDAGGAATHAPPRPFAVPVDHRRRTSSPSQGAVDQRGRILRRLLLAADLLALYCAFFAVELAFGQFRVIDFALLAASVPLWVLVGNGFRLYHLDSHRADYRASDELGQVFQMATIWSWGTLLVLWLVRPDDVAVPRVALFWGLTLVLLMIFRSLVRGFARRQPWYLQHALVVGPSSQAATIVRKINRHPEWGIIATPFADVSGRFPARDRGLPRIHSSAGDGDVVALARELNVDRVMLTPALSESRRRAELVCELTDLGVHVDLIPSWSDVVGARLDVHEMEGMPLLTVPRARLRRSSLRLKRALDLAVSGLAVVLLAPVLAAFAIAIKLDSPGPVFFRQRRVGKNDRPFEVFKFRSMRDDADACKDEVAQLNLHGGGNEHGMFKIREDPRVTRVGRLLRRYSLDELPQLFNIVRGDMSLVGPRPLIEKEDRQVEGRFRRRLGLTPGLTGLWQVNGRSEIPFDEMVSLDYLYVTNWSMWGDVKVLMRTFSAVLRGGGAY
ncbi:MAG TPA: sugar transferase [Thermoleophilaceae bacterium]|jgi:exopolysaccharide biosynthesis polyprenyl glycosylphosphotransferase